MNELHIGSDFDDFLQEEGILAESEAVAVKRVLALQIREMMQTQNISKAEMARRMNTSRAALDRLLDPDNNSVTLNTIEKAARSVGRQLHLTLV